MSHRSLRPTPLKSNDSVDPCSQFAAIPEQLIYRRQWVNWILTSDAKKIPISPDSGSAASVNLPTTWSSFEVALDALRRRPDVLSGIGFVFTENDNFVGVDLDKCLNPVTQELSLFAQETLARLNSYSEVSPSGTGVKCVVECSNPVDGRRNGQLGIEVYGSKRFFTLTGQRVGSCSVIHNRTSEITALLRDWPRQAIASTISIDSAPQSASDDQVLMRASRAKNGPKFSRLWQGDATDYNGDLSRADMGLCRILAYWCGPNLRQIDRIFRRSKLYRPKWDRINNTTKYTYGMETILLAVESQGNQFYGWQYHTSNDG